MAVCAGSELIRCASPSEASVSIVSSAVLSSLAPQDKPLAFTDCENPFLSRSPPGRPALLAAVSNLQPVLHCPDPCVMTYVFKGLKMLNLTFEVTNDPSTLAALHRIALS